MYLTPEARIADYETKGWWRGITVDELLKETLAGDHAELAVIDPSNREALDGVAPGRPVYDGLTGHRDARSSRPARINSSRTDSSMSASLLIYRHDLPSLCLPRRARMSPNSA